MSEQSASEKPSRAGGIPVGSLDFDYTDDELATIRSGTMLDGHASALMKRGAAMRRAFVKWALIGFIAICVIMVLIAVLDDSFDSSGWFVLPLALGLIAMLGAFMVLAAWTRFTRPAKSRQLNVISKGQAKIQSANKKAVVIQFGGIMNARRWQFPPEQASWIINGEFYDVYWAGETLAYVELAHLEANPA